MVLVGKINKEIVAQLHVAGVSAVGLAGDDGGLIRAEKASSPDADLGFVGQVAGIDTRVLQRLADFVPVVASVGVDADGQSYNINADTVAGRLAAALGRAAGDLPHRRRGDLPRRGRPREPRSASAGWRTSARWPRPGAWATECCPKLAAIAEALESGVEAVQVIDGRIPHSVLVEIFTEAGIGTKITA